MKKVVFIKFGGSLITDKKKEEVVNLDEIDKLSKQIKEIKNKDKDYIFLIGNGAGSFGHIQVEKYQLKKRIITEKQKVGFAKVSNLVLKLNYLVVSSLIKYNLPAISIKPSSIIISSNEKLRKKYFDIVSKFLETGYIPVLSGDMILDDVKGGTVLSTDKLFYYLVKYFKKKNFFIDKVIFCGLTDGVLDEKKRVIKMINKKNFLKIKKVFYNNPYIDVTGGMKKKVEIALKIAKLGIKSYIISGDNLKDSFFNKNFLGTVVE